MTVDIELVTHGVTLCSYFLNHSVSVISMPAFIIRKKLPKIRRLMGWGGGGGGREAEKCN